jgi:hypothetical protein
MDYGCLYLNTNKCVIKQKCITYIQRDVLLYGFLVLGRRVRLEGVAP